MANGNPFYVQQGPGYAPALMGLAGRIDEENKKREELAKVQKEQQRVQAMKDAILAAYDSGDPNKMARASLQYPEMAQQIRAASKFKDEVTEKDYMDTLIDIYLNPTEENVKERIEKRKALLKEKGVSPEMSKETDSFLEKFRKDKEAVREEVAMELSLRYSKRWLEAQEALNAGKKDVEEPELYSERAKLNYELKNGLITQAEYDERKAAIEAKEKKEGYIKPESKAEEDPELYSERAKLNYELKNGLITQAQYDERKAAIEAKEKKEGYIKPEGVDDDKYKGLETGYKTYLLAKKLENTPENYDAYYAFKVKQAEAKRDQGEITPYLDKLTDYVPSTRITAPLLRYLENKARYAAEQGNPLTAEDMYKIEFEAQHNRALARTKASRLVQQRVQNVEAAFGLLDDMKETSKVLNYPDTKFFGMLSKWGKEQINDPIFTEYMTQRSDALFVLGNALKQNGLTDKSIEVEEEAARPTMSPKAFNAWVNTQIRALNRSAKELNKAYNFEIEQHAAFPAGQGGAPTNENPTPVLEGSAALPKGIPEGSKKLNRTSGGKPVYQAPDGSYYVEE